MNLKKMLNEASILFSNNEDYFSFLRELGKLTASLDIKDHNILGTTRFGCIEDIEYFFGIMFGEDTGDGEVDLNNIRIIDKDNLPEKYPCLLVTSSLWCMTDGHSRVSFSDYRSFNLNKNY